MKHNIFIIYLCLTCVGLYAQTTPNSVAKPTGNVVEKSSKKTTVEAEVPTLDAAWKPITIDHLFGVRGGYGFGNMRREPARENKTLPSGLLNFGISYRLDVPEQKYVGTIEVDLQYMEKGFAYSVSFESDEIYSRRYAVIELPILWQPYFPLGKGESRIFLNAGPYLSYTIGQGVERMYNHKTGETIYEREYLYDPLRDNRVEYGVVVGGGINVGIKRFSVALDFRYNIALSDVLVGVAKNPNNPFRSPVDQMNLSLGLQYRFIKGKSKRDE